MLERASCGACGADDPFLLFSSPDTRNRSSGERFPLGRCRRCGHVYVLERPPASEIGRYYPAGYDEHRRTDKPSVRKHSKRHRRIRLGAGERVLDVGCGSGYDLLRLKERGCELYGVETDPGAAANARANGISVFNGSAERADFPDGHFHQVTMNHCIEHFHDPGAALRNIRRMTHPEGSIYLTFPTAEAANFRIFRGGWYHLDVPRHLHFFTHDSFLRLTKACGLRIVHRACTSGTRGFRRSLGDGLLARLVKAPPGAWIARVGLKLVDGLRQGDVAEYLLRRST
ncbi:MAG: class I SAM-dependent methyltransferase [Planctomycetes bacterium]|nr:class I SAM-dependent methyltransferase [Planctomycetota bacterium]